MPLDTALSTDVRGLPLSGLNDNQVKIYDALLTDIYHYVPGTAGLLETLLERMVSGPGCGPGSGAVRWVRFWA